jgi:hypothetical protein
VEEDPRPRRARPPRLGEELADLAPLARGLVADRVQHRRGERLAAQFHGDHVPSSIASFLSASIVSVEITSSASVSVSSVTGPPGRTPPRAAVGPGEAGAAGTSTSIPGARGGAVAGRGVEVPARHQSWGARALGSTPLDGKPDGDLSVTR